MDLVVGTLVGVLAAFAGISCFYFMESQKKKQTLIQLLTKALIELNSNRSKLQQVYSCVMPEGDTNFEELEKKFRLLLEDSSPFLKCDDTQQLKAAGEFLAFADIKTAFAIDSIINRYNYLNKIFEGVESTNSFSREEIKTIYHGNDITDSLIKTLTGLLIKLKPQTANQ